MWKKEKYQCEKIWLLIQWCPKKSLFVLWLIKKRISLLTLQAYVSLEPEKIQQAKKRRVLENSLGIKISDEFYDELYAYVEHQRARKELFGDK